MDGTSDETQETGSADIALGERPETAAIVAEARALDRETTE
jgi:hypothetical protein